MTSMTISRRAALSGLAFAAVAAPMSSLAAGGIKTEFQRLLARYRQLCADELEYDSCVLEPMAEEWWRRAALVPHVTATYDNILGDEVSLTTARPEQVATATRHVRGMKAGGWDTNDRFNQACRQVRAGDLLRRRQLRRIRRTIGAKAIEVRSEHLNDLAWRAGWAAIESPVDTAADLIAKIELISESNRWECDDAQAAILADARRLAGVA